MNYLRQNSERLVIKYMLTTKPELISELNIKEWFYSRTGQTIAWGILRCYKLDMSMDRVHSMIQGLTKEDYDRYTSIDSVDEETMQQVILYFKFMGMFTEMYTKRDNFSAKEVTAMQAIAEIVKRGEVTQRVIDIVLKLYEKLIGDKFYNKSLKRDIVVKSLKEKEERMLNKYTTNE
jgi:hypothetical protein